MATKKETVEVKGMQEVCDAILKCRADQGLTISSICEAAGLSRTYYENIAKGNHNTSLSSLNSLCTAVGLELQLIVK